MSDTRQRLAHVFAQQEGFAKDYSPLYARLFGVVAGWLEMPDDPLTRWLIRAGATRRSLDVSLLLPAGLHRDVLAQADGEDRPAAVRELAAFFPSAGGARLAADAAFPPVLRQAIEVRQNSLGAFIRTGQVQTNETGRGLCWLLPLLAVPWPAVHLVDIGASAGLNLVAERRAYRLAVVGDENAVLDLGAGQPVQFVSRFEGQAETLAGWPSGTGPTILSRTGCDQSPFRLDNPEQERTLMAYIWGDQAARLQRLQEGLAAFQEVQKSEAPIRLYPAALPEELAVFLRQRVPGEPDQPAVLYNTYMTAYLPDKGASLGEIIDRWAGERAGPVLWLAWEPDREGREPPFTGWCAWTADLWQDGRHHRWRLAWVHPHGGKIQFEADLADWLDFWSAG